jgi:hypothetical protein
MSARRDSGYLPGCLGCSVRRCSFVMRGWDAGQVISRAGRTLCGALAVGGSVGIISGCSSSSSDGAWTRVQSSRTESTVVVGYLHGSCDSLTGATVARNATSVRIRLHVESAAGACDAALRSTLVRVRLGTVLGSQTIEGACRPAIHSLCQPSTPLPVPSGSLRIVGP